MVGNATRLRSLHGSMEFFGNYSQISSLGQVRKNRMARVSGHSERPLEVHKSSFVDFLDMQQKFRKQWIPPFEKLRHLF